MKSPLGRFAIAGTVLTLLLAGALLPVVSDGQGAVQVRNALALEGTATSFGWRPAEKPVWFVEEDDSTPIFFQDVVSTHFSNVEDDDALAKALAISRHLHPRGKASGGMIAAETEDTYNEIMRNGKGYCADFTQVFNALAYALNLPVREWGMSFDEFSGDGHAFNEVFSSTYDKWIFIDSFNGFYVTDSQAVPLSFEEFRQQLLASDDEFQIVKVDPRAFGFASEEMAADYYRRAAPRVFLWDRNDIFSYESNPLIAGLAKVSRAAEQAVGIFLGIHPGLIVHATALDNSAFAELRRIKWLAYGLFWSGLITGLSYGVLLFFTFGRRRTRQ